MSTAGSWSRVGAVFRSVVEKEPWAEAEKFEASENQITELPGSKKDLEYPLLEIQRGGVFLKKRLGSGMP